MEPGDPGYPAPPEEEIGLFDDDPLALVAPAPVRDWIVGGDTSSGPSVDDLLDRFGRLGGPTEHGWHVRESGFLCSRRAHFDSRSGVGDPSKRAFAVGSTVHEFLAAHYRCVKEGRPLAEARDRVERTCALLRESGYVDVADEAGRLYHGYWARYVEGEDWYVKGGTIVAVEKRLDRELPWGEPYSGRLDLVIKAPDGYIIVDHKTSARQDADFRDGWALSPQMLGLEWLSSRVYRPIVGFSINGLIKTQVPAYKRIFFAANRRVLRDWLLMLRYRAVEREMAGLAGHPPNFAACIGRYGKCHWFDECAQGVRPARNRDRDRDGDDGEGATK